MFRSRSLRRSTVRVLSASLAAALLASYPAAAQSEFSEIVVFGTSLSDPGNAFALVGGVSTPPDYGLNEFLMPDAPYARGGHHLSNGPTWIEQFARTLGLAASVQPAFRSSSSATNFAVATARAREAQASLDLSEQVSAFLQQSGGVASADALYVIEMGSTDVGDAFVVAANGGNPAPILQAALTAILTSIQTLYAAGARQFFVWNVPNIALTPSVRALGPAAGVLATGLTVQFNSALEQGLTQLSVALPGISLVRFDAFQAFNAINADPEAFGLTNVTTACVTPDQPPFHCRNFDEFFFWDGIHPTRAGHAILAQLAAAALFP